MANASAKFRGVIPILPVPFDDRGAVDETGFRRVVDKAIEDGVHALAMFGLASEYAKLADHERVRLTAVLIEQAANRLPVVISITHHSAEVAVTHAAEAEQLGADGVMVLPPFFLSPGVESVKAHICAVAQSVSVPVIVQYAPAQTGIALRQSDWHELRRECSNLHYVKVDASPSGPLVSQIDGIGLNAMVGYMGLHLPDDFRRRACAVMPTVSVAGAFLRLWSLLEVDMDAAVKFHQELLPLLNFMMQSVELLVAVEKIFLVRAGVVGSSYCRSPRWNLDELQLRDVERFSENYAAFLGAPAPLGRAR
jgi:4-hydroxy-tetrahydrodipicolinate synthase